ncbi:MAG: glycosyltransferase family 2 protein [Lachnospiraceae bacterium]|nr:glycosyltransferase family 2 protein [Lachnospiraceae bacterium]
MKKISIIVPIYYGEAYITGLINQMEACKKCLEKEDYLEILLINDAPEAPISSSYHSSLVKILVINMDRHMGIHGARIKGLKESVGDYILFLDQDDYIRPEYFRSQFSVIGENDAVVCQAMHGNEKFYESFDAFKRMICKEFIIGEWNSIISPGQVLLRKYSIPDVWIENILQTNGGDDWFLWLCMIAKGCCFTLNKDILYEHIVHGQNYSDNLDKMLQAEQEVIQLMQKKKIFTDKDFLLLIDGFFKRNECRMHELYILRKKWDIFGQWVKSKQTYKQYLSYLISEGIHSVAIYGCGVLGEDVYAEIRKNIEVKYFIDRNANRIKKEIPVYSLEDKLPEADGIIITLFEETEKIKNKLRNHFSGKIFILKNWLKMNDEE